MQSRIEMKTVSLEIFVRRRHWKPSLIRVCTLMVWISAVLGLLLAMSTDAAEEEECAAPVCAIICGEDFESTTSDELKEMCGCDVAEDLLTPAPEAEGCIEVLFVQRAESATLSNTTLTLFDVGDVIWFTDRPDRAAGVWKESEYLALFEPPAESSNDDTNSFSADPPNAVLACTLESSGEELNVVMELTDPVVSSSLDESVSYSVVILEELTGIFSSNSTSTTSTVRCTSAHVFVDAEGPWEIISYTPCNLHVVKFNARDYECTTRNAAAAA